jgi:hypothetical protein
MLSRVRALRLNTQTQSSRNIYTLLSSAAFWSLCFPLKMRYAIKESPRPWPLLFMYSKSAVDIGFTESNDIFPTCSHLVHGSAMIFVDQSHHRIEFRSSGLHTKDNQIQIGRGRIFKVTEVTVLVKILKM